MVQTKEVKEIVTKPAYRTSGGLRGILLGDLKSWNNIKVVALNHPPGSWKIHYLTHDDFVYVEKRSKGKTSD